jgi:hypothetical protein
VWILLTTTAIVAFAGAAAADGHISIGWSGTATAGVAREGAVDATETATAALVDVLVSGNANLDADNTTTEDAAAAATFLGTFALQDGGLVGAGYDPAFYQATAAGETPTRVITIAEARAEAVADVRSDIKAARALIASLGDNGEDVLGYTSEELDAIEATLGAVFGTAGSDAGDFDTYAEINATVTGSVTSDNGLTLSAAMSVDAGMGYDFADDDGFDSKKTNGAGLDHITLDAGTFGTLKFAPDDIAHLVDDDDETNVDVLYTNDFGVAKFSFALDIDTDSDVEASAAGWALIADDTAAGGQVVVLDNAATANDVTDSVLDLVYNPANAADVQWSAKVEAPIGDIATAYAAFDEEGGYDVGGSATVAGVTLNALVKSEALAVANDDDAEFGVGAEYTMSGLTVGATWNSIEDDNQWGISGSYTMGAISISADTDEGEEWTVEGSYDLGAGASLVGGVNYTEDAFVGVSFSF